MSFAETLKEEIEKNGLSSLQAARLLEVPLRTMEDWELSNSTPPEYVQKALLYCLNAIREDMITAELDSAIKSGVVKSTDIIKIARDRYNRIIDWEDPYEKNSRSCPMEGDDVKSVDALRFNQSMTARNALQEICKRMPYLSDEDFECLYPVDCE